MEGKDGIRIANGRRITMAVEEVSVSDYRLTGLNHKIKTQSKETLPEIARQFDAFFLQSMLKSASLEQHFINESSPFLSKPQEPAPCVFSGKIANPVLPTFQSPLPAEIVTQAPVISEVNAPEKQGGGKSSSVDDFVKALWPYAQQAANLVGLDPKILMAQAALETGWGHFIAKDAAGNSSNNLFNIKARSHSSEQAVTIKTTEFIADTPVKMLAFFKKYPTMAHSFQDYVSLIKENPRYQAALANAHDPEQYTQALQGAGYASDPNYANKILSIYHGYELQHALERNGL